LIGDQRLAAADAAGQADGESMKSLGWFHYRIHLMDNKRRWIPAFAGMTVIILLLP
jgi:hypothetical protein